jgi:ubiquinone/menaquinone biosynthesis C-methylase UbiE
MNFSRIGLLEKGLEAVFWNFLRAPYNRAFALSLGLRGHESVLEFGSGSGAISRHLATLLSCGGHLVCVDTSKGLMDIARKRLAFRSNVEFENKDLRSLRLSPRSFDLVVVHFVLHDVSRHERRGLVAEMTRLLKPGGTLVIREPTRKGHGMSPQEVRELASMCRLKETKSSIGRRMGRVPYFNAFFAKSPRSTA